MCVYGGCLNNNPGAAALDLSFPAFDRSHEVTALPSDLSALLVGIAARQAESPTAGVQAAFRFRVESRLLEPLDGAFNGTMARALIRWRDG